MSEADELFDDLGYKKDVYYDGSSFIYVNEDGQFIEFDIDTKYFKSNGWLNTEELEAINLKCRELGWIGGEDE